MDRNVPARIQRPSPTKIKTVRVNNKSWFWLGTGIKPERLWWQNV